MERKRGDRQRTRFVSGPPGNTERSDTVAELDTSATRGCRFWLDRLYRREVALILYSAPRRRERPQGQGRAVRIQNSAGIEGELAGCLDPAVMARKVADEKNSARPSKATRT